MLWELGIGFWGTYALEFSASTGYGLDLNNMAQRVYYIIWCYFHMGLGDWIKWLQPPVCYEQYSNDAWLYWFLHVCVTILVVEIIWKVIKKIFGKKTKNKVNGILTNSYEFNTSELEGVIKLGNYYRLKPQEWFKKVAADKIPRGYYKSMSNICTEVWLHPAAKTAYATIVLNEGRLAISLYDEDGKQKFFTKCTPGETITFGSEEENDPEVIRLFGLFGSQVKYLNSVYNDRKSMIEK